MRTDSSEDATDSRSDEQHTVGCDPLTVVRSLAVQDCEDEETGVARV
jgi:hypothetical protein